VQAGFVPARTRGSRKPRSFRQRRVFGTAGGTPPVRRHFVASAPCMRNAMHKPHPAGPMRGTLASLAQGSGVIPSQNNRRTAGVGRPLSKSSSPQLASNPQAFAGVRGYFVRFERFTRSVCGTATYLLLRLRLAAAPRRPIAPPPTFRFSRLQLIVRISSSRTSQSSICEANTACVDRHASNK
jgi:hypothetical protein